MNVSKILREDNSKCPSNVHIYGSKFVQSRRTDEDDVIWALGVALMVVMIAGSLCLLVKCNANMLNRRKKKKVRAAERRKSMKKAKQEAAAAAAKLEIEKEKNKAEKVQKD